MSDLDMRNSKNLKDVIKKAFDTIISVRDDRIDLNEMMQDARDMMKNAGISPSVFSMAQKYLLMNEQDREAFREFFDMIREVLDDDFQPTLFDAEKAKKKELAKARKEKNKAAPSSEDKAEE